MMRLLLLVLVCLVGCNKGSSGPGTGSNKSLVETRKAHQTKLVSRGGDREPIETPPAEVFQLVKYQAPAGALGAYLTPDPKDGKKHPAIIWMTGGDCNSIGEVWNPAPAENDQTAAAYREKGIIMMFPSLRGGNQNPGKKEGLLGEVDDIVAAAEYLAKKPYVDPARIYLGGHSTGGTLVLLVAESTDRFRAIFSFGPADDVSGYPDDFCPFDRSNAKESRVRSPKYWLAEIKSPTYVFEGDRDGNIDALHSMKAETSNPLVKYFQCNGKNHFSVLAPTNRDIASQILKDTGPQPNFKFAYKEL